VTPRSWRPRLGRRAERDFVEILQWTRERFGPEQARRYRAILLAAIRALEGGPDIPGARHAGEILPGVKIVHAARGGRKARHFLLYRVAGRDQIVIGRILHDAMDIERHIPADENWD
jgi:toxin ParE1/3/4